MGTHYVKVRYLDASAIVKVFFDEQGSDVIREYYYSNAGCCATSLCLTEALSVLKTKWKYEHINDAKYFDSTEHLLVDAWSGKLEIDEINFLSIGGIKDVKALAEKYSLDWSDALQLETIKRGTYAHFSGECQSILVTADAGLAKAAEKENIRVWNCIKECKPEWA
jgi:predicted nucleic acid-binding protein